MSEASPPASGDPPRLRALYDRTRTATAAEVGRVLATRTPPIPAGDLVAAALARLEQALAEDPTPPTRACRRGCGWCCHQPVFVSAPEAVVIANHLRASRTRAALVDLCARLRVLVAQRQALGDRESARASAVRCAFLDDEQACSIHALRPVACRGHLSASAEACAERYADPAAPAPPIDPHAHTAARAVLHGISAALGDAQRGGGLGELHALLLSLLTEVTAAPA